MRIISGTLKGRSLKTISGTGYRPAMSKVRESLFSLLEARGVIWSEATILDLFAGSGSLAFEGISRGAKEALFVEQDPKACVCIKKNADALDISSRCTIMTDDVLKFTSRRPSEGYSVVFIDPPYAKNFIPPTLRNLLRRQWLSPHAFIVAEVEKHLPIDMDTFEGLTPVLDRPYGQTRILIWQHQE